MKCPLLTALEMGLLSWQRYNKLNSQRFNSCFTLHLQVPVLRVEKRFAHPFYDLSARLPRTWWSCDVESQIKSIYLFKVFLRCLSAQYLSKMYAGTCTHAHTHKSQRSVLISLLLDGSRVSFIFGGTYLLGKVLSKRFASYLSLNTRRLGLSLISD